MTYLKCYKNEKKKKKIISINYVQPEVGDLVFKIHGSDEGDIVVLLSVNVLDVLENVGGGVEPLAHSVPNPGGLLANGNLHCVNLGHFLGNQGTHAGIGKLLGE